MPGRLSPVPWVMLEPITTIRWRKGLGAASMRAPASTPISSVFTSSNSGR